MFCVIIFVLIAAYVFISQIDPRIKTLTSLSTHIVIGKVESIECQQDENGLIWTYVTLSVEQYLKGNGASAITIRTRGGQVEGVDLAQWVSGEAEFSLDERVKVFLVEYDPFFFVVRGHEGKFTLNE